MVELSEDAEKLLIELYNHTGGKDAATVSMFEIGEAAGLDRDRSGAAGEELIGWEMVEVRTLSGGIAIAEEGVRAARSIGGTGNAGEDDVKLGAGPVLDDREREAVDRIVSRIKTRVETLGLDFDRLSEIMADLKTAAAQLASPRPKTAVFKEVLISILNIVDDANAGAEARDIRRMLGK